ncbi:MAG: nickel-dependent hydrogenase large subunit [Bacillota bacterium]
MSKTILLSPVTHVHGTFDVTVTIENHRVSDARASGTYFRGFEEMVHGRDPRDLGYFTSRICGICSTAHNLVGTWAVENMVGIQVPLNAVLLRNIMLGADILQNHIRHFYTLGLWDWVKPPPGTTMFETSNRDYRLPTSLNEDYVTFYNQSKDLARKAHELTATFGAKAPHIHGIVVGGVSVHPEIDKIRRALGLLKEIKDFIRTKMVPVAQSFGLYYPEYYLIGLGAPDMMTFGLFPDPLDGRLAFPEGVVFQEQPDQVQPIDVKRITEAVTHSWYQDQPTTYPILEETEPYRQKESAYSWVKAPRYQGRAMEVGPLPRLIIKGSYRQGRGTLHRIQARMQEAAEVADYMEQALGRLEPCGPIYTQYEPPRYGESHARTGAMRGTLAYWLRVDSGKIEKLQIITPSAWATSPRDERDQPGAMELALIGTPIEDEENPVEVGRIIRSYDPCISCACHVLTAKGQSSFQVV